VGDANGGVVRRSLAAAWPVARRFLLAAYHALRKFFVDRCTLIASAISYHVLFSIFPLTILFVSIFGLVIQDQSRRDDVVEWLLDRIPLSDSGATQLEKAVTNLGAPLSTLGGVLAVLGLLWAASGMMSAIRRGLTAVWDLDGSRSAVRGKLLDFILIFVAGLLVLISFGLTIVVRVVDQVTEEVPDSLDLLDAIVSGAGELTATLVPLAFTFATFALAYRYIPPVRPRFRDAILGAAVGTIGFELAKTGFAIYLANFADYNAIYGSLGAAVAFLFFVYIAACVFLYGAEFAAQWPKTPSDVSLRSALRRRP
jgi:membrane protein